MKGHACPFTNEDDNEIVKTLHDNFQLLTNLLWNHTKQKSY